MSTGTTQSTRTALAAPVVAVEALCYGRGTQRDTNGARHHLRQRLLFSAVPTRETQLCCAPSCRLLANRPTFDSPELGIRLQAQHRPCAAPAHHALRIPHLPEPVVLSAVTRHEGLTTHTPRAGGESSGRAGGLSDSGRLLNRGLVTFNSSRG